MCSLIEFSVEEVNPMVLTNKIKSGLASVFVAGGAALSSGLTIVKRSDSSCRRAGRSDKFRDKLR